MKAAVAGKLRGMRQRHASARQHHGEPPKAPLRMRGRARDPSPVVDVVETSASSATAPETSEMEGHGSGDGSCGVEMTSSREDGRVGLMNRQAGSLNVWKAPVEGTPAALLRYAKRCSRSPSPIPRRKVSFRLSATAATNCAESSSYLLASVADTANMSESFSSSFDDTCGAEHKPRRSESHAESMAGIGSSVASSAKSSLKVSRQSVSVVRTYDPTIILLEGDEKRVAFSTVSVHLHPMTLGDNPAVSAGVPVQIGWKATESFTRPLDVHESEKGNTDSRRLPRSVHRLRIGPTRRENILKEAGEDRGDVLRVLRSVALIQSSRAENAGSVSTDDAAASSSSRNDPTPPVVAPSSSSQRIRSGAHLPKVLQRIVVVSKPNATQSAA
jgi:hypothetical protein